MSYLKAITARHSVRSYTDIAIKGEALAALRQAVSDGNRQSGLSMQLCLNEPKAFAGPMARYGHFRNVKNYIALVGKKGPALEEVCGYYGEKLVLEAQRLGLNTCWVAATYSKGKTAAVVNAGEKLLMVIALGYGETPGASRKTKSIEALCKVEGVMPEWFRRGMEAVQLAPTAVNQQKLRFTLADGAVTATPGTGFYTKTDLGIAKLHFEIGAGESGWHWNE